jgi:hypothetical protein
VTGGTMKGAYALIAHPYAPGVNYNRIFLNYPSPVFGFSIDSNGLLFHGMGFNLNF